MYADVDVKTAIANGGVRDPRMQAATRAMTPTGMYPMLGYSWELKVPTGVEYVDGVDGARKAVREQVSCTARTGSSITLTGNIILRPTACLL